MQFIIPEETSFFIGDIVVQEGNKFRPVNINRTFSNAPVNLDHVVSIEKSEHDLRYGIKISEIIFISSYPDRNVLWSFSSKEKRDAIYNEILEKHCSKIFIMNLHKLVNEKQT